jgi:ubiquinone/menaquinone biosynthesis C-methylase UbiE
MKIVELGCGLNKRFKDSIGIDLLDHPNVDIVDDCYSALKTFDSESVDYIYSYHFLEHCDCFKELLIECQRVLKLGGIFECTIPHFSNPYYYSDYTHINFFGLYTFEYLCEIQYFKRKVPNYGKIGFKTENVSLGFRADRPFYLSYAFRKLLFIFNFTPFMQEIYEWHFSSLVKCSEITFKLKKI